MSTNNKELFELSLRRRGFSITSQRHMVFKELIGQEPLSMRELYERLRGQVDRASLYRIISVFEKSGVVVRIPVGWKYKLELSEAFNYHHHHITCIKCNRVIPIEEDETVERLIKEVSEKHAILPFAHQLEIQGFCRACRPADS